MVDIKDYLLIRKKRLYREKLAKINSTKKEEERKLIREKYEPKIKEIENTLLILQSDIQSCIDYETEQFNRIKGDDKNANTQIERP